MAERVLTLRELNRTTLARQMLLSRTTGTAVEAVTRLVGLQAQASVAPFVGLWTRVEGLTRQEIAACIEQKVLVKATMMRGTLHLVTAVDYLQLRSTLQPVLDSALSSIQKGRAEDLDVPTLLEAARPFLEQAPRSFAEITTMALDLFPDGDPGAMRYAVRMRLPLVQVPVQKAWSYPGNPKYTLGESWLGKQISPEERFEELILRYLSAFGPASIADMQAWSGWSGLKTRIETMRPALAVYRDERGRELFDHPELPIEGPDLPAPERFLPEFDNVLLSHADRTRILADEHRSKVYLPVLRVRPTILVDGFVAGTWRLEKARGVATLVVQPFRSISQKSRDALTGEAEKLVRFAGFDAGHHEVRVEKPVL